MQIRSVEYQYVQHHIVEEPFEIRILCESRLSVVYHCFRSAAEIVYLRVSRSGFWNDIRRGWNALRYCVNLPLDILRHGENHRRPRTRGRIPFYDPELTTVGSSSVSSSIRVFATLCDRLREFEIAFCRRVSTV